MTANSGLTVDHFRDAEPDHPIEDDRSLSLGAKLSLILHLGLGILILAKGIILPDHAELALPPVLRVDVVGLPDLQKPETARLPQNPAAETKPVEKPPEPVKPDKKVERTKEEPAEVAEKDELVLKPKAKNDKKAEKDRKKRLNSALERMKALNQIEHEVEDDGVVIKGNKVSPGTSLSPDAREAGESSYLDILRDHLADNWTLQPWLARQTLSAHVQLYIDPRGHISSFRFVKSSGNPQFDDQVKRTIHSSEPYPTPPGHLSASLLRNGILVRFPL